MNIQMIHYPPNADDLEFPANAPARAEFKLGIFRHDVATNPVAGKNNILLISP